MLQVQGRVVVSGSVLRQPTNPALSPLQRTGPLSRELPACARTTFVVGLYSFRRSVSPNADNTWP